ncbi:MAG: type II/IV secretion system protein [Sedimentisphaerales bacterium]|nr:type II/IV secretion system protein [Sedimentisphaerales bacterium]
MHLVALTYFCQSSDFWSGNLIPTATSLPFNPIKLLCLIGWVYLCMYLVQRVQFSPLVPKHRKSIANFVTLLTGPILLLVLSIVDIILRSYRTDRSVLEIIKEKLTNFSESLRSQSLLKSRDDSAIKLLDSAGRSIKEIYGHGNNKRHESRILDLTEQIIAEALEQRASDILIDPTDYLRYSVRFRVDGVLRKVEQFDSDTCAAIINSIKAVSNMDIAEKRRPQDGAFRAKTAEASASFRVASAGVVNGEKLSVRVLNQNAGQFTLDSIGLAEKQKLVFKNAIAKPAGMILLCGPTGSGKTTTLYAMLNEIDLFTRNVITVEDPIEYVLSNASQIEVNPKADITFAKTLRSILRQDPDVICVGEIRDEETAGIALRASQTGHLVLATVHSESNASALVRLLDLGITPMLLSSGLSLIATQRLFRRLCNNCKMPAELGQTQIHDLRRRGINVRNIYQAQGCQMCYETGYYGRTAIFDILVIDDKLKDIIANQQLSLTVLRKDGDKKGKSNLYKQGLKKVVSGMTSFEELKRVVG